MLAPLNAITASQRAGERQQGLPSASLGCGGAVGDDNDPHITLSATIGQRYPIVHLSPEKLQMPYVLDLIEYGHRLTNRVGAFVFDEADTFFIWGSWRPTVSSIGPLLRSDGPPPSSPSVLANVPIVALTATASFPYGQARTLDSLCMHTDGMHELVLPSNRPNIFFDVVHVPSSHSPANNLVANMQVVEGRGGVLHALYESDPERLKVFLRSAAAKARELTALERKAAADKGGPASAPISIHERAVKLARVEAAKRAAKQATEALAENEDPRLADSSEESGADE